MIRPPAPPHVRAADAQRRHPLDFEHTGSAQPPEPLAAPRPRTDPYQRVRLRSWPEMRRLPAPALPTVARICALIASRPIAAYLVAARLHEPTDTVLGLLDDLRERGHVDADAGLLSLPFAIEANADSATAALP